MPNVKQGNKKCGSFEILLAKILFFDNYFCVIELCLCRLNSLSLSISLARCLSVCLQLKATAESMLMLTSASWESRCLLPSD